MTPKAVVETHIYHWLANDHGEDEDASFEHYVTFPIGNASATMVVHNEPLAQRTADGAVCEQVQGKLEIQGKPAEWAAKPERTCNWGKQRNKKECE
ncbi:uncharacterized protein PG986_011022 [Apiospora aurea]|uniref:Uncharacterized protein n=1 Tax=Apiospora aurea TaxID=335848 RepID=A0ABR1Q3W9_9PEZI